MTKFKVGDHVRVSASGKVGRVESIIRALAPYGLVDVAGEPIVGRYGRFQDRELELVCTCDEVFICQCKSCIEDDERQADRPDVPRVGLFNHYGDAQEEARLRADLTGYRYRVRFDRANRWWHITESIRSAR